MIAKLTSVCAAIAFISMVTAQTGGQTGNQSQQGGGQITQCQQTFLQSLYKCLADSKLESTSFLWLVANNTQITPPDNPEKFKKDACDNEQKVGNCMVAFMRQLINATMCLPSASTQNTDQRPLIHRQFMSLVTAYDNTCAHPCRRTLFSDLRDCYAEAHLDPKLFLSNITMARGAVIGGSRKEAHSFCEHKEELMKCMKKRRDECPESPRMLSMIGLDIDSMDQGVAVLCKHTDLYITGIDCFAEQTKAIEQCMDKQRQDTLRLMMDAQNNNLSEPVVQKRFCEIRLDHVDCDLSGWKQKSHKSCTPAVIGLRTELECGLLPEDCTKGEFAAVTKEICHIDNFYRGGRGGGSGVDTLKISLLMILVMSVIVTILK